MSGPVSVGVTNTPVQTVEETDYVKTGDWHDVAETVLKHVTMHEVAVTGRAVQGARELRIEEIC